MIKGDTPAQDRIIKQEFEKLCGMWCTEVEIADFFDVDEDTLNTWCKNTYEGATFSEVYKKKSSKGKRALRRLQFKSAEDGSVPMQIWLGKQQLGQRDKVEYTDDGMQEINNSINNIADLINNPKKNRTEDDLNV